MQLTIDQLIKTINGTRSLSVLLKGSTLAI